MSKALRLSALPLLGALCVGTAVAQGDQPVNLALGSVSASSGVYAFSVALANTVHKYDPAINVTAVAGGGGFDHAKLMKQGVLDWSVSGSPAVAQAVGRGEGNFKNEGPWEPVRLMFMRNVNAARVYVRADAGVKSWADLAGKPFSPGVPGTRDMTRAINADKVLGTGITMIPGSLEDSTNKLKEGAVVGLLKGSPHDRFDSAMIAVHAVQPLIVVGFTKEEAAKLSAQDPMNTFIATPKGGIRELPELGPVNEMSSAVMVMSSSRMSQEVGYRIIKAVYQGWAEINEAFGPTKGLDPIADAFQQTPEVEGLKFHAGIIQMAKERGIEVPARLVPAEYRDVR